MSSHLHVPIFGKVHSALDDADKAAAPPDGDALANYYLLPTTYHLLPTAYYLLPSTYIFMFIRPAKAAPGGVAGPNAQ